MAQRPASDLKVEAPYRSARGTVLHYPVESGQEGKPNVTVRVGAMGVYCCLTCYSKDCVHAEAALAYAVAHPEDDQPATGAAPLP